MYSFWEENPVTSKEQQIPRVYLEIKNWSFVSVLFISLLQASFHSVQTDPVIVVVCHAVRGFASLLQMGTVISCGNLLSCNYCCKVCVGLVAHVLQYWKIVLMDMVHWGNSPNVAEELGKIPIYLKKTKNCRSGFSVLISFLPSSKENWTELVFLCTFGKNRQFEFIEMASRAHVLLNLYTLSLRSTPVDAHSFGSLNLWVPFVEWWESYLLSECTTNYLHLVVLICGSWIFRYAHSIKFICNPQISTCAFVVIHGSQGGEKGVTWCATYKVRPDNVVALCFPGSVLPASSCPFCIRVSPVFFTFWCFLLVILLCKKEECSQRNAEVLPMFLSPRRLKCALGRKSVW